MGSSQNIIRNNINQLINSNNLGNNKEKKCEENIEILDKIIATKSLSLQSPKKEETEINVEKKK